MFDRIIPTHSALECAAMYGLTVDDLVDATSVLDCPSAASYLIRETIERGGSIVGADPTYSLPPGRLIAAATRELEVIADFAHRGGNNAYRPFGNAAAFVQHRRRAARLFREHFLLAASGRLPSPYVAASPVSLPFGDDSFSLTLTTYSPSNAGGDQSRAGLRELARVTAGEVRVAFFDSGAHPTWITELEDEGVSVETTPSGFEIAGRTSTVATIHVR